MKQNGKTLNKKRRSNGITLIALVVTIIVLLILAGVSIQMLTGQNRNTAENRRCKNQTFTCSSIWKYTVRISKLYNRKINNKYTNIINTIFSK